MSAKEQPTEGLTDSEPGLANADPGIRTPLDPRHDVQPMAPAGTGYVAEGDPVPRIDGPVKVTGAARYAAEHLEPGMAFGVVVNAAAARGRITALHLDEALAVPGVLDILHHGNRPRTRRMDLFYKDMTAPGGSPFKPFHSDEVLYSGQPVALVVAESFEAARCAAALVRVEVATEPHSTDLLANLHRARTPSRLKAGYSPPPKPTGDAQAAWDAAPVKVDAEFYSGVEHHNPMEMHATTVLRDAATGHLTIHDKTQSSQNSAWMVKRVFGLSDKEATVKNAFVGGAFGSGLRPQYNLLLAVMAAQQLRRSVRVVLTRQQMFTFGHRPETWQRVRLAADAQGRLQAVLHEAIAETSRLEDYVEVVVNWSGQLYRCDNVKLGYKVVPLDQYSPLDMRAPGAAHGVHALEVAMDELAHALKMDPLALRLANYAEQDASGLPYSSKELRACYAQGAERFGWAGRPLAPRSMKEGHELVGWGMATGTWDAMQMVARVRAVLDTEHGTLLLESAASDIGTGSYTVMAQIAAAALGLRMEDVTFRLGDSQLPLAPVEGGSSHVATVGSAVAGVCDKLRSRLVTAARKLPGSPLTRASEADILFVQGHLRLRDDPRASVPLREVFKDLVTRGDARIEARYTLVPKLLRQRKYVRAVHSAVFAEVRVDEAFGTVRVTRVVSAVAAGRIMNQRTASSQISGAVVWGIGAALHEETHADHRLGRFMNHNFAEYHIPVNADVQDIQVLFVDEDDRIVSRLGAKGVGEIGIVGVAAAICNAIFHATGRRVRSTPMTPDKVMAPDEGWAGGDAMVG